MILVVVCWSATYGDHDVQKRHFWIAPIYISLRAIMVDAVSLKLPTFWAEHPQVWLTQAEAQFHIRKITEDETKYYYVVAALDQQTASRITDILSTPPEKDKYTSLRSWLLGTFCLGKRDRASKLLHMNGLGDKKPSELMDEMLVLELSPF